MSEYANRLIPDYYEQLGLQLKPFTLGHIFLMEKNNCEFVKGEDGKVGVADLILGLCICSRSYREFNEFIDDENALDWCKRWNAAILDMVRNDPEFNLPYECKKFAGYMKRGIKEPKLYIKENESNKWQGLTPSNPYQNLRHLLITEFGYDPDNVMDATVASAVADYFKYEETNGQITIVEW